MDPEQQMSPAATAISCDRARKKCRAYSAASRRCAVAKCPNTGETKEFAFFSFPDRADVQRRLLWADFCQKDNWQPGSGAYMCSAHFSPKYLRVNATKMRLKKGAVPSYPSMCISNRLPEISEQQPKAVEEALLSRMGRNSLPKTPHQRLSSTVQRIFCRICNVFLEEPCYKHLKHIADKSTVPYAFASLPEELCFGVPSGGRSGKAVFARETLRPMTVFGPLVGTLSDTEYKENEFVCHNVGDNARRYFQLDSDQTSNWMKFVRFAQCSEEPNAAVYEIEAISRNASHVVFVTTRTISPGEELRIGYSHNYSRILGYDMGNSNEKIESDPILTGMKSGMAEKFPSMKDVISPGEEFRIRYSQNYTVTIGHGVGNRNEVIESDLTTTGLSISMAEKAQSVKDVISDTPRKKRSVRKRKTLWTAHVAALSSLLPVNDDSLVEATVNPAVIDMLDNSPFVAGFEEPISCSGEDGICDTAVDNAETDNPKTADRGTKKKRKKHSVNVRTPCLVCGKSVSILRDHMNARHPEYVKMNWEFPCDQCPRRFPSDASCRSHAVRIHQAKILLSSDAKESAMAYIRATGHFFCRCSECGVHFPVVGLLDLHRSQCHGEINPDQLQSTCPACDFVGSTYADLLSHISEHIVPKGTQTPCLLCGKYVMRLGVHVRDQHPEELRRIAAGWAFECVTCGERFAEERRLRTHVTSHRTDQYQCVYCARLFEAPIHIIKHVVEHKVDGRFTCPQCDKWFDQYRMMRNHFNDCHNVRKNRRCEACGTLFNRCTSLKQHIKSHSASKGKRGRKVDCGDESLKVA